MTPPKISPRHRQEIAVAIEQMKRLDPGDLIDLAHQYARLRDRLQGDDLRHVYQRLHDAALNEIDERITA